MTFEHFLGSGHVSGGNVNLNGGGGNVVDGGANVNVGAGSDKYSVLK